FASHYHEEIDYYEIWDQPNLYPHWGERYIDPTAYTHLLQEAYGAVKEGDPEALVLTAGLSPNVEEGGRYMSDILFLRKMYEAGAKGYFDILAIKPYGMWYEPTDRRLSPLETNFSRPLLLRDVMLSHGDGDKARCGRWSSGGAPCRLIGQGGPLPGPATAKRSRPDAPWRPSSGQGTSGRGWA
ncbi:MAG: hypothetical protein GTO63_22345, partial [Anaerolineae bacterium]|nr:hypothetical protein [Anaerolineae bacterium]NIN97522.1 hypothetical protein [Anaerolineae bacterium]NIQ80450.1 hypothetical protein [Anaerolineae bacterium]